jgi:3-oxoadipate enol-lactonase
VFPEPSSTSTSVVQLHGLTSSRARDRTLGLDVGRGLALDGTTERAPRVLRYDARGHGRSTGRHVADDYRWDRLADDLLGLLDHVFPGERVHGVGPSMGTGTLLHAASRRAERFASLTLVVPPTAWETRRAQASAYDDHARLVERHGVPALVALGEQVPRPPAAAAAPRTVPDVADDLLPTLLRGAAQADLPPREVVASVGLTTLVLAWTDDPTHPLSTARELCDLLPRSRLVVAATPDDLETWPDLLAAHVSG